MFVDMYVDILLDFLISIIRNTTIYPDVKPVQIKLGSDTLKSQFEQSKKVNLKSICKEKNKQT